VDHVLIVGAGIGGLAASAVLSRIASRVTLVERAERPTEVGAALALQPNGMAVLDRLGLLPRVLDVGTRIDRMNIRSASGAVLATGRMPDLGNETGHAVAVRRTDLHRLLLDAIVSSELVQTRFGCAAVSADPAGAGSSRLVPIKSPRCCLLILLSVPMASAQWCGTVADSTAGSLPGAPTCAASFRVGQTRWLRSIGPRSGPSAMPDSPTIRPISGRQRMHRR